MLIDSGTTLSEARAIARDVRGMAGLHVRYIVLTHNHFDHILGASAFDGAEIFCAPQVAATIAEGTEHLRADALRYGADAVEVDRAIAALRVPEHRVSSAVIDLGDRTVSISHPGRGHTDHDLIAVVTGSDRPVVFCGDLVEESGEPSIDADSDPAEWPATLHRVIEAGTRTPCSCRATAPWSMRHSSADSRSGCSADCDEFQSPNVTQVIAGPSGVRST